MMETRQERIERLKNNKVAFGLLDIEDKELLKEISIIERFDVEWRKDTSYGILKPWNTYRISKNYTEKTKESTDIQEQIKHINKRLGNIEESTCKLSRSDVKHLFDRLDIIETKQGIVSKFSARLIEERLDKIEHKLNEKGE